MKYVDMTHITSSPTPKLRKASQPRLSYPKAQGLNSGRAKEPRLAEPAATDQELNPGDRVEGLGGFGRPTGEFGTVEQANEDDAVVKWDEDGRVTLYNRDSRTFRLPGFSRGQRYSEVNYELVAHSRHSQRSLVYVGLEIVRSSSQTHTPCQLSELAVVLIRATKFLRSMLFLGRSRRPRR
jgi:hypothetical protein